jgi:hypothetical protein
MPNPSSFTPTATVRTAALTGAFAALVGLLLAPLVDGLSPGRTFWLIVGILIVGVPAYFFVFGVSRERMVGLWALHPALLKRIAACLVGAISAATLSWPIVTLLAH